MKKQNTIKKVVTTINSLPTPLRSKALSLVFGRIVPYVGTSRAIVEEMTDDQVVVISPNLKPIRNHIGQVHACAMALAVETATGFVTAMYLPPTSVPLIRSLKVDYNKRTRGDIRAVATLTEEQKEKLRNDEKGSIEVAVQVTDDSGEEPISCVAIWAWIPKKRL